jgi:hypothetical protein
MRFLSDLPIAVFAIGLILLAASDQAARRVGKAVRRP